MADGVEIVEYTDPACPWAFSAEPERLRLRWLFGDQLQWVERMVGLTSSPDDLAKRFTPDQLAGAVAAIAAAHHMPISDRPLERLFASLPACRAVVAARRHGADAARCLLRELRIACFSGELIDDPATIAACAERAGIDPADLATWTDEAETEAELRADMDAARDPLPSALALRRKLAEWEPGRWRYTCPSYVLSADGETVAVPGFQPFDSYEVALANLAPGLERAADAESAQVALEWADTEGIGQLATVEVAALTGTSLEDARSDLAKVATEHPNGAESFWTLG